MDETVALTTQVSSLPRNLAEIAPVIACAVAAMKPAELPENVIHSSYTVEPKNEDSTERASQQTVYNQ